jgi:hypothetical protein
MMAIERVGASVAAQAGMIGIALRGRLALLLHRDRSGRERREGTLHSAAQGTRW